jgi:hypothetical protein
MTSPEPQRETRIRHRIPLLLPPITNLTQPFEDLPPTPVRKPYLPPPERTDYRRVACVLFSAAVLAALVGASLVYSYTWMHGIFTMPPSDPSDVLVVTFRVQSASGDMLLDNPPQADIHIPLESIMHRLLQPPTSTK